MRDYELMTIHRPGMAEDEVDKNVALIENHLSESGATGIERDMWGKRRFAYEIDHLTEGYYTVLKFKSETGTVETLDRVLSLADEVVRHKIVRLGD